MMQRHHPCAMAAARFMLAIVPFTFLMGCTAMSNLPHDYRGTLYSDSKVTGGAQAIPGTVMCAYYDLGGEGVAYHDTTPKNHGSGELNPADGSYLNEFRMGDGVDTLYT